MKKLSGGQLAGGNSVTKREENDFYATDPQTLKMFLYEFWKDNGFEGGEILEPACGQGHISKTLKELLPRFNITSTDLIDRGYGTGGIDFLTHNYGRTFDVVITNPPFSLAKEFIEKGLEVSDKHVIMLCKIQLLEGIKRKDMFENIKEGLHAKSVEYDEGVRANPAEYCSVKRPEEREKFFFDMHTMTFDQLAQKYVVIKKPIKIVIKKRIKDMIMKTPIKKLIFRSKKNYNYADYGMKLILQNK